MNAKERAALKTHCRNALEDELASFQRGIRSLGLGVSRVQLALKMRDDFVGVVGLYNAGGVPSQFSDREVRERMDIAAEVVGEIIATSAD